jgi:putative oxidoreductase
MTELKPYADLLARVLLAVLFIIAGFGKLGDVQGFTGYMTSGGVPAFLAWPTILLEFLGGIAILVGFQTRIVALALAGFSLLSAVLFHLVPADQMQMTSFYKNLGLAGGYILLVIHGAGRFSADAYLAAKSATA